MAELPLNAEEVAQAIGVPLEEWPGNCDGIASRMMKAFPVKGMRYARGFWTGPVAATSIFAGSGGASRTTFAQHTWLRLDDGRACDPTRWTFTMTTPSIYIGPADHYDEAGIGLYADQPAPIGIERTIPVGSDQALFLRHRGMLPITDAVAREELAWLAKRDPEDFADPAMALQTIIDLGHRALIPIDIRRLVLETDSLYCTAPDGVWFEAPGLPERSDAAVLSLMFDRFLDPDRWSHVARAADEMGFDHNEIHDALDALREHGDEPADGLDRTAASCLSQIAGLTFGSGNARQIDAFAQSHGISEERLNTALAEMGRATGMDLAWSS